VPRLAPRLTGRGEGAHIVTVNASALVYVLEVALSVLDAEEEGMEVVGEEGL